MKPKLPLSHRITDSLDEFRLQTAKPDALIQLSLLALLVGLLTGAATIVAFIFIIDASPSNWLPNNPIENFEDLTPRSRLIASITEVIPSISLIEQMGLSIRFLTSSTTTGLIALLVPQIMGLGYDTLNSAIMGQLPMTLLLTIMVAKLVITVISVGRGMPACLIGPSIIIGAWAGH